MTAELRPCPMCGAMAKVVTTSGGTRVQCSYEFCGVRTKQCHELEHALGIWCSRPGMSSTELRAVVREVADGVRQR